MATPTIISTGAFGALGRQLAQSLAAGGAQLGLLDAAPTVPAGLEQAFAGQLLLPGVGHFDLTGQHEFRDFAVRFLAEPTSTKDCSQ